MKSLILLFVFSLPAVAVDVVFEWDHDGGADIFNLYCGVTSQNDAAKIHTVNDGTARSVTIDMAPEQYYCFMDACNVEGCSDFPDDATVYNVTDRTFPPDPGRQAFSLSTPELQ